MAEDGTAGADGDHGGPSEGMKPNAMLGNVYTIKESSHHCYHPAPLFQFGSNSTRSQSSKAMRFRRCLYPE